MVDLGSIPSISTHGAKHFGNVYPHPPPLRAEGYDGLTADQKCLSRTNGLTVADIAFLQLMPTDQA